MFLNIIDRILTVAIDRIFPDDRYFIDYQIQKLRELEKEYKKEKEKQEEQEDEEDEILKLKKKIYRALREIQSAKVSIGCPYVRNLLEEIELFTEEKLEELVKMYGGKELVDTTVSVLEEKKVEDWEKLSDAEKDEIKKEIISRLRRGDYGYKM